MTVRPGHVPAGRRAGVVEQRRLREEYVGAFGGTARPRRPLGGADFLECPADMDRAGTRAVRIAPRYGGAQRPVHLEYARSVSIALELAAVPGRKAVPRNRQERARGEIAQNRGRRREIVHRSDPAVHDDFSSEGAQISRQRV